MPTITIEDLPLEELAQVPGEHDHPQWRASVSEVRRAHAQALLDVIAWLEVTMPDPGDPWPASIRRTFGATLPPDFHTHRVLVLDDRRWESMFGPLALNCWILKIEAGASLPRLAVQRIDGQIRYGGHLTSRALLSAARLKELPSLSCVVTAYP